MTFLQPVLLLAVPFALLPLVIHLLNRLRYRSVKWAAVMFLIAATRSSTRRARLRQYLLLAARMLVLLFLIVGLSRPVVGGWLGLAAAGRPETHLVLLDRSASMELVDRRLQLCKREHAVRLLAEAAARAGRSSRFVLIESALLEASEIAEPLALPDLACTAATDTAADIPAMLRTALEYLVRHGGGRTEIWLASDLQRSNWRPASSDWETVTAQLAALPQKVRVRVLAMTHGDDRRNVRISLQDVSRSRHAERPEMDVVLEIAQQSGGQTTLPLTISCDGTRRSRRVTMDGQMLRLSERINLLSDRNTAGWGMASIPADGNMADNTCYFTYGRVECLHSVLVATDRGAARTLGLAAAPAPERLNLSCARIAADEVDDRRLKQASLVIWQGTEPDEERGATIMRFVNEGGGLVLFPPDPDTPAVEPEGRRHDGLGFTWGAPRHATREKPFRVTVWDETDGPLRNAADGTSLSLDRMAVNRCYAVHVGSRAESSATDADASCPSYRMIAAFSDDQPFLLQASVGRGNIYICTTLPRDDVSSLGDGPVLVPMLQRMLQTGERRIASARNEECGTWRPRNPQEVWPSLSESAGDPRSRAGVYRSGDITVALNRPAAEDLPETLDPSAAGALFGDVPVQVVTDLSQSEGETFESEIWHVLICGSLLFGLVEAGLLLGMHVSSRTARP